jgi:LuxR family transcriptional regulator
MGGKAWRLARQDAWRAHPLIRRLRAAADPAAEGICEQWLEPAINHEELVDKEWHMRQLADMSHVAMKKLLLNADTLPVNSKLSEREIDVLRSTADGKTAGEVAEIMGISERTVNFHINQAVAKLQARNKINAAVRAAMSGLLG